MLPAGVRILLCTTRQDMRKSFDTLAAVARDFMGEEQERAEDKEKNRAEEHHQRQHGRRTSASASATASWPAKSAMFTPPE